MKKIILAVAVLMVMAGVGKMWAAEPPVPQLYWRFIEFSGDLGRREISGIVYHTCYAPTIEAHENYNSKQCRTGDRAIALALQYSEVTSPSVHTTGAGSFPMPGPDVSIIGTCSGSFYNLCVRNPVSAP